MNETFNLDSINALTKVFTNYIDQQVDKKVGEVLASHDSMKQIDENFEKRIREIANAEAVELIDQHCGDEAHKDDDDIHSAIGDHDFSDQVYEAVNDHDFSDDIESAINDHDFSDAVESAINDYDFSDAVESALRNYDLNDHVKRAISELQFKVSVE